MSVISSGVLIVSGVTSSNLEIVGEGKLCVLNGGQAFRIGVSDGGAAEVSSDGVLLFCSVGSGGSVTVLKSGYAQDVTVEDGECHVSNGAIVHHSIIRSGGVQYLYGNAFGASAFVMEGGILHVCPDGLLSSAVVSQGGTLHLWSRGLVVAAGIAGVLEFDSGGILSSSTVSDGGMLNVQTGCTGYDTTVNEGAIRISAGGRMNRTTVNPGGNVEVLAGGTADGTTICGGTMAVFSGGTATGIKEAGGYVSFENGASVGFASNTFTGVELNGASATVHSGTTAVSTVLNGGRLEIFKGGSAVETTVGSGGCLEVKSGGVATDVIWTPCVGTVNSAEGAHVTYASAYAGVYYGSDDVLVSSAPTMESQSVGALETMYVFSGGTAGDLRAQTGGLVVVSGGVLTGSVTVEAGAEASACEGAELNFDLRRTSAGAGAFVNDLSAIRGSLLYSLTVNGDLKPGKYDYSLAGGADGFHGAITVRNAAVETLGELVPGEKTSIDGVEYLLILAASSLSVTIEVPDVTPPTVSDIRVTPDTPTNQDVLVTAVFSDDAGTARGLYHLEGEELWSDYLNGVVVTRNTTVYLKAVDASGIESEVASVAVTNIDKDPPVITLDADPLTPARRTTLTASTEPGVGIYFSRDGGAWTLYTGTIEVTENGSYAFSATDAAGNTGSAGIVFENIYPAAPQNLVGTAERVSWDPVGAERYILEYSTDHFGHGFRTVTAGSAVDMPDLPAGTYQWRVRADDSDEWAVGADIVSGADPGPAKVEQSNGDGCDDVFFADPAGTWGNSYFAMHVGSIDDWGGTGEIVSARGKGRIRNFFFGSSDPNVMCLTDGDNGDAIFVDDAYTELPEEIEENTARLFRIDEIRAGVGDDIVDMTSWQFEYTGDGMTIRGGDGNDTIWANKGDNRLFGDAGNDRIVGASGNDVIAGGIGNDRMHGGGGNDVFTFCDNWGTDTVEQLAGGSVTLWFASGSEANWNAETLTYTDGANSVKVSGVSEVSLKFGKGTTQEDEAQFAALSSIGAFADFTSERIFEESGKGILVSL